VTTPPAGAPPQWTPEHIVAPDRARSLIGEQFPQLADAPVEPFGNGWDNTAYLVGGAYVFRFPRRSIAAPLIEREMRILPSLARDVPAPISAPCFAGAPGGDYPWPFAGYPYLAGTTICATPAALGGTRVARELGAFLRALHAIDPSQAVERGLPPDEIGRLDHDRRFAMARDRFAALRAASVDVDAEGLLARMREIAPRAGKGRLRIVHGDLYARHVLAAANGSLAGVIDWGDLHLGDPALDLAIGDLIFTPADRAVFVDAYGDVDPRTRARATYRAIYHAALEAEYGLRIGDAALANAGVAALHRIAAPV